MALDSNVRAAEAPVSGYLHDGVDCDELIATVYGMHIYYHCKFVADTRGGH